MTFAWGVVILVTATLTAIELVVLNRRRRLAVGTLHWPHLLRVRRRSAEPAMSSAPEVAAPSAGDYETADRASTSQPPSADETTPASAAQESTERENVTRAPVVPLRVVGPNQRRRLRSHAARSVLHWISIAPDPEPPIPAPSAPAPGVRTLVVADPAAEPVSKPAVPVGPEAFTRETEPATEDGILYVDAAGRLTFANQAARALLDWNSGELVLGDVLAGGRSEAVALLEAVARQEIVERAVTLQAGARRAELDVSALALRDRDGNLWGAALFLRQSDGRTRAAPVVTP